MAWGEPIAASAPADLIDVVIDGVTVKVERTSAQGIEARDNALKAWEVAKDLLQRAKESEMEARKLAFSFAFGESAKEGTNTADLGNGWEVKGVRKVNTKIVASNDDIDAAEDRMPMLGNEASFLFERIIVWTPEFSKSEYKKLDPTNPTHKAVKAEVDKLIETSDGAPTLDIKAPKAKLNA